MDSSSESVPKEENAVSTPLFNKVNLNLTLSSISGPESLSSGEKVKTARLSSRRTRKWGSEPKLVNAKRAIHGNDNETWRKDVQEFGDFVREAAVITPEIGQLEDVRINFQSHSAERVVHKDPEDVFVAPKIPTAPEIDQLEDVRNLFQSDSAENVVDTDSEDVFVAPKIPTAPEIDQLEDVRNLFQSDPAENVVDKDSEDVFVSPKIPTLWESSSLNIDTLFDVTEQVGEHSRKYERKEYKQLPPVKRTFKFNRYILIRSNLLWEEFIANSPEQKKKKHVNHFFTDDEPVLKKFFKSREKKQQLEEMHVKKKKPTRGRKRKKDPLHGMTTPSAGQNLGWMSIKGICYAQRREICDVDEHDEYSCIDDSIEQDELPLKRSKNRVSSLSTEYSSPSYNSDD